MGFTNSKEAFFLFFWAELGLGKGCLYLVGAYWAGFGFLRGGTLCKMLKYIYIGWPVMLGLLSF